MDSKYLASVPTNNVNSPVKEIPQNIPFIDIFNKPNSFHGFLVAEAAFIILVYSWIKRTIKQIKSNSMLKIGLAMLEPFDIELQDELDNLANSIREVAKADRAVVLFFHNGEYNSIMHFKKYTVVAESYRKGLVPIKQDHQGKMIGDFLTQEDLVMYRVHRANNKFVEVNVSSPSFSVKRKAALIEIGITSSLDRFLLDESNDKAFGLVSLQYYSSPARDSWLKSLMPITYELSRNEREEIEHHITMLHSFIASKIKNTMMDKIRRALNSILKSLFKAEKD